jgi:hypothetical protein
LNSSIAVAALGFSLLFSQLSGSAASAQVVTPSAQCDLATRLAEQTAAIPDNLMAAIARVESGRRDPDSGVVLPWPWTINVEGDGHLYESKAEAIAAVRAFQARGARSIDVGCMQVNLMHHPDAFASLEQAFDPVINATYAARFLNQLHDQTHDWTRATAMYHSATPEIGDEYQRKVAAVLSSAGRAPMLDLGRAWAMLALAAGRDAVPAPTRVMAVVPMSRQQEVRIIPLAPPGSAATVGRSLDSYRARPIPIATTPARSQGGGGRS